MATWRGTPAAQEALRGRDHRAPPPLQRISHTGRRPGPAAGIGGTITRAGYASTAAGHEGVGSSSRQVGADARRGASSARRGGASSPSGRAAAALPPRQGAHDRLPIPPRPPVTSTPFSGHVCLHGGTNPEIDLHERGGHSSASPHTRKTTLFTRSRTRLGGLGANQPVAYVPDPLLVCSREEHLRFVPRRSLRGRPRMLDAQGMRISVRWSLCSGCARSADANPARARRHHVRDDLGDLRSSSAAREGAKKRAGSAEGNVEVAALSGARFAPRERP